MLRRNVFSHIVNLDAYIAVAGMGILVLLSFAGVIMRYFLARPISWQEEVMVLLVLWIVFFGASYCFRQKSHIAVDLVVDLMPAKAQAVAAVLIQIVVVVVLAYIGFYGYKACLHFAARNNTTNIIRVPYSIKYAAVPIGCALMIVSSTWRMAVDVLGIAVKKDGGKPEVEAAHD